MTAQTSFSLVCFIPDVLPFDHTTYADKLKDYEMDLRVAIEESVGVDELEVQLDGLTQAIITFADNGIMLKSLTCSN